MVQIKAPYNFMKTENTKKKFRENKKYDTASIHQFAEKY